MKVKKIRFHLPKEEEPKEDVAAHKSSVRNIKIRFFPPKKEEADEIKKGYFVHSIFPPAQPETKVQAQRPQPAPQTMPQIPPKTFEEQRIIRKNVDGISIPEIKNVETLKIDKIEKMEKININIKYPLISANNRVYAYAHIFWNHKTNELVYFVVEPRLSKEEEEKLNEIKDYIQEKIDINFSYVRKKEAIDYIAKMFDRALDYFDIKSPELRGKLRYYILRDFIGLEKIEPLMRDRQLEDISCDGVGIPIYVYHRDPKLGSIKTNIVFNSRDELDSFVTKLSERCSKSISVAQPLLDGTLPDGSRVQATLGTDIARHGSNFTIRKFTEMPLTPVDMIEFNTVDLKMMAFFWLIVEHGASILISGGTATGKTSLLNVLSLFIKPQMKIVSIEDTAELRLPHPHWVPEVARTPISEKGKVDMYELLKESLRQRPDYIIVGEVRGKEAYVLFQQIAIGHPGLSTIHAENFPKLFDRLTTKPINLPPSLIENLDLILFLKRIKKGDVYLRRLSTVTEVIGFDRKTNTPIINDIFRWDVKTDEYKITGKSVLLKKIMESMNVSESEIAEEIRKRAKVLKWMYEHKIKDYRKVGSIVNLFYASPDFLLQRIEET